MVREIAAFTDGQGKSASLLGPGKIVVYQRQENSWQPIRERTFSLDQSRGLKGMRQQMEELVAFLGDCKVFVGQSVVGMPYFELEKAQISVWECEGIPSEIFDSIVLEEETVPEEKTVLIPIPTPREKAPGCFFISIKEVQENELGVTTKQIVMPLLAKKEMQNLEILCNHLPPWLEPEAAARGFTISAERLEAHVYRVLLQRGA